MNEYEVRGNKAGIRADERDSALYFKGSDGTGCSG